MSSVLSVVDSENYRNQRLNGRKSKLDEAKNNLPKPSKRAALGTITNVAATRVQPFRAAKAAGNEVKKKTGQPDVENDENAFSKHIGSSYIPPVIQSQQHKPFTIHVDPEPQQQPTDVKQPTLNEAVTCLSRQPLACISKEESRIESEGTESPMVIGSPDDDLVVISSDEIDNKEEITDIDTLTDLIYGVPEYAKDIHKYLKQAEGKNRPKPGYMKKQPDINISMRSILVDWLVEVAEEYKLMPQTLYLTVNYIDRFLSCMSVLRGKLQLVGTACMLVASKFEEIYPPEVSEFVYITDDTYTNKQGRLGILNETAHNQSVITREGSGCDKGRNIINRGLIEVPRALTVLRMEHLILKTLNFDLSVPTALNFLERYVLAAGASNGGSQLESLAKYLCELTLIDYEPFIKYLPSTVAASAVCIACHTLGMEPWTPTLSHHSGYYLSDIQSCVIDIHRTFRNASQHPQQAIREKFTSMRYHQVAQLPPRPQPPV